MPTTLICPVCNNTELNSAKDLLQKLNDKKKGYSAEELFKHLKEEHNYTDLGGAFACSECNDEEEKPCNGIKNTLKDLFFGRTIEDIKDVKKCDCTGYFAEELFKHLKEEHNYTDLDAFASVYNMFFVEN